MDLPVDNEKQRARHDESIAHARRAISKLIRKLDPVLIEPATSNSILADTHTVQARNVVCSKKTGEQIAHEATDSVDGENV